MESLDDLLPVALAIAYLFARFVSRRRPATSAPPRPARPPRSAGPSGRTPFEELIARLEEQTQPDEPPATEPEGTTPTAQAESGLVRRDRESWAAARARTEDATAFRSSRRATTGAATRVGMSAQHGFEHEAHDFDSEARGFEDEQRDFDHDRHAFAPDNPYSEEALERAADADHRPSPSNRLAFDPHTRPAAQPAPPPAHRPAPFADRLRSAESLRDAVLLSTVLERRPARRRR